MVNRRLIALLESKQLLTKHQFGFRKQRSTTDAIVTLENAINDAFFRKHHLVAVFFDLEKAYDTTWKHGIAQSLYNWGLRGSSLSVTLFLLAINSIFEDTENHIGKLLYVDDIVIYYAHESIKEIEKNLQKATNTVSNNAKLKGFKLSVEKTKCIHFCKKKKQHEDQKIYLQGNKINTVQTIRYLGLTLDKKLSWKPHINAVIQKCKNILKVMRYLSHTIWGADREILLKMYTTLIQSRVEYMGIVYQKENRSATQIYTICNSAIRLAIGAHRTSPTKSLYSEAGIIPPKFRAIYNILKYAHKIKTQPNHPNYTIFYQNNMIARYSTKPLQNQPLTARAIHYVQEYEIDDIPLITDRDVQYLITQKTNTIYRLELSNFDKTETPPQIINQIFCSIVQEYTDKIIFFTDGSKTPNGVACAVSTEANEIGSWKMHPIARVFTAELYAIYKALMEAQNTTNSNILIGTDSLSSIMAIKASEPQDTLLQLIKTNLANLEIQKKMIIFVWIPSHTSIKGNEKADTLANKKTRTADSNLHPIRLDDINRHIKQILIQKWQDEWNTTTTQLKLIKPTVEKWEIKTTLNRKEKTILTRLRIGHTQLTHNHLFEKQELPKCPICKISISIKHIIEECPTYNRLMNSVTPIYGSVIVWFYRAPLGDVFGNFFLTAIIASVQYKRAVETSTCIASRPDG
ncbi:uncharacterized protein LOC122403273 [Colletes gigas]|uniref:uncharacterized protein LOC122403273 n=1 Tax=Colletes gigas TaxID=935657 RepID=UPI001C9B8A78|nr:uncharacterized protein LOC122403273 [Colletes gigas]